MRRVRSPFVAEVIDADVTGRCPTSSPGTCVAARSSRSSRIAGRCAGPRLQRLACGLAAAISAVHAAGVVHRDLKPGNVMMVGDDPVVIDFGIAQAGEATTRLTETGMFVGTPGYLAPEVIAGKPSGQSSDVHSWGGDRRVRGDGQAAVRDRHLRGRLLPHPARQPRPRRPARAAVPACRGGADPGARAAAERGLAGRAGGEAGPGGARARWQAAAAAAGAAGGCEPLDAAARMRRRRAAVSGAGGPVMLGQCAACRRLARPAGARR